MSLGEKIIGSKPYVVSITLLLVFIVGIADYLSDIDVNLAIFYLLPFSFVTWTVFERTPRLGEEIQRDVPTC